MFPWKFNNILCMVLMCILTTESSPTVGSNSIAEKNRFLFGGLDNFRDEIPKDYWTSMSNHCMLSPEQLRFLEYKDLLEKAGEGYYAALWPYFNSPKQGSSYQNKFKKNSEVSRGMYNALNHMDMFNAGK